MNIKDLHKHLRPREKLMEKGVENLKDKELLAILLRTGRNGASAIDIANQILLKSPLSKLLDLSFEELVTIIGIDSGKACTLLASFELTKRALKKYDNSLPLIDSPQKAVDQLTDIRAKQKEYFVCLYLNARNQLIYKETISIGTLNSSLVHPREVFAPAFEHKAASVILAHNHPSGSLEKSSEDQRITDKLISAGQLLGIEVIDHLLVTKENFMSFKEKGWLQS
jgi:DNA repair protein RadC